MPYIARLYRAPVRHAHVNPCPDAIHAVLLGAAPWEEIPLVGLASLETTDEPKDGCRIYQTTIKATLRCPAAFHLSQDPCLYRLLLTDRRLLTLGDPLPPYPLEQLTRNLSSTPSATSAHLLTITLKGPYPPLTLITSPQYGY